MNVKSTLWRTSISSYVRTILRLILGLLTFRMLYSGLSKADFGFWSLLWSVFGYGVLVDFGLGFAAQKRVAELSVSEDWQELSTVLSTIVTFFLGVGLFVLALAWFGSGAILGIFKIEGGDLEYYRGTFLIFFVGMALGFPLGVFPEILRGLQKISLVNTIVSASLLVNFVLLAAALKFCWGLKAILIIALATTIGPDLVCGYFAWQLLPHVRINPRFFAWSKVGATMSFSLWAYMITATNIILGKTDQLVISTCLSVSAVAIYVTGSKVSEMFSLFTRQLQEALSPAAAHLNAKGQKEGLRELLVQGTRLSVMIATPLYLLCVFYLGELIRLLTGNKVPEPDAYWSGQVLLFWFYVTIMTHGVSKRIFIMIGHERRLMWLGVWEALANLVCSVTGILIFKNVVSVAIGSLIPTLIIGFGCLWPWSAREAGLSPLELAREVLFPSFYASVPMLALLGALQWAPWHQGLVPFWVVALESCLALAAASFGFWKWSFTGSERAKVMGKLGRYLPGRTVA